MTSPAVALDIAAARAKRAPLLPFRRVSFPTTLWSFLLGSALVIPAVIFLAKLPRPPAMDSQVPLIGAALGLALAKHVLIGPLIEEIVFRGLILQVARRYLPTWLAIAISTALFAVPHLTKSAGVTLLTLPIGCLLAWLVIRTGSLVPGFICHAAFNLMAAVSFLVLKPEKLTFVALAGRFPAWGIVVALALAAVAFGGLHREFARRGLAA